MTVDHPARNDGGADTGPPATRATAADPAWAEALREAATQGQPHEGVLGEAWDRARDASASAARAVGEFDQSHGHVLTRAGGVLQAGAGAIEAVGGGLTALAGVGATATGVGAEAGLPAAVGGVALAANGLDNTVAGLRTAITGEPTHTLVAQGAGAAAHLVGASPRTAERISTGVDVAQGFAAAGGSALGTVAREGLGDTAAVTRAARIAADAAQSAGATRGVASALKVGDETLTDLSSGAAMKAGMPKTPVHPEVQRALDNIQAAQRSPFHGKCAEVGTISQALHKGVDPAGGLSVAVDIRKAGQAAHGAPKPPCASCEQLLRHFEVRH